MGLKWFRARLSLEEEASKVPAMTGLYRRISYFESTIQKNVKISAAPPSVANDSTSDDNETVEYDRSKADLTSQTSSSIIESEEITVKDDKKPQTNNHIVENVEPSIKDSNAKEQSERGKESNKITKDQNDMSDTKNPIYSDNELVI